MNCGVKGRGNEGEEVVPSTKIYLRKLQTENTY